MQIKWNLGEKGAIGMTPFPPSVVAPLEPLSATSDAELRPGATLPDLIRQFYGSVDIHGYSGFEGFLTRDNKDRNYDPSEDPFVMGPKTGPNYFKKEALRVLSTLVNYGKEMGLPVKRDSKRHNIEVLDDDAIWAALDQQSSLGSLVRSRYEEVSVLCSNIDIAKKFALVRGVIKGWWVNSYSSKTSSDLEHFKPAVRAYAKACAKIVRSQAFKSSFAEGLRDQGDPIDTGTGWPLFGSSVSPQGLPIDKYKTVKLFEGKCRGFRNFSDLTERLRDGARATSLGAFPCLTVPIRRTQPSQVKRLHVFTPSESGMRLVGDQIGNNTVRTAWMPPYVLNLTLSPLQTFWKAMRKHTRGTYHDGSTRRDYLQKFQSSGWVMAEGDYSNYDRFMPVELIFWFFEELFKLLEMDKAQVEKWISMLKGIHTSIPIVWPDYSSVIRPKGKGWIFTPPSLGLLSGLKITSEEGTTVNAIINGQTLIDAEGWSEAKLTEYYLGAILKNDPPRFLVQSDDTLLIARNHAVLKKQGDAFVANVKRAGLKGSLAVGDRFLMRHLFRGVDLPVSARVWQNTLSNEESVTDYWKFAAGSAARTDGMAGLRTIDAFGLGSSVRSNPTLAFVEYTILKSIKGFISRSYVAHADSNSLIDLLIDRFQETSEYSVRLSPPPGSQSDINGIRAHVLAELAMQELKASSSSQSLLETLLMQLHKERHVPSSALLLDQILKARPDLRKIVDATARKENQFYMFAMRTIGISPDEVMASIR